MKQKKRKNTIKYSKLFIFISLLLFCLIIGRTIQLGLSEKIDGVNLKELASKRTTRTIIEEAKRGTIYSSNGDVLAQTVSSYTLIAYLDPKRTTNEKRPQHVVNKEETAEKLAPILGMDKEEILFYLSKEGLYQTEFGVKGKGLTELVKKKIDELNLPGIDFIESYKRYYPKGDFASYMIGYTKATSDSDPTLVGEMGIEKQYDKILKGENGFTTFQKDLKGYRIPDTYVRSKDAVQGKNIFLTVDSTIQFFVEQAILNEDQAYDWDWFHITIMDAKTGAVLATTTHPSFDPNIRNITNYLDYQLQAPYEPGSTMKTYTYMAAMENGVYDGNETYKSGVYTTSDGTEIGDWNRNGWGVITFDKGYAMSSNVGVINMINRHMDSVMLRQYFKKLGFGRKTGLELPNEAKGNLEFKYETEIYNAGFGQGITTTPIQNAKAMTVLTNDGMLLKPYLVAKILDTETGEVIEEGKREEIERVASTSTVQKMLQLMDDCVNEPGNTGSGFRLDSGELIGKTGTAQIANEKSGGYLTGYNDVIASFSGIYPKSNPQIIIYASVSRPTRASQKPLSNAVKAIVENISKYYGNEENLAASNIKNYKVENFVNQKTENAKISLSTNTIPYVIIGNGDKVIDQYPEAAIKIISTDTVYLITNDTNPVVPYLLGMSSKTAKSILQKMGMKVKLEGIGYVTYQSLQDGTPITKDMEITLQLSPKYSTS